MLDLNANTKACFTDSMPGSRLAECHPECGGGGQQPRGAVEGADGGGGGGPGGGGGGHDGFAGAGSAAKFLSRCQPWWGRAVAWWAASSGQPMILHLSSLM